MRQTIATRLKDAQNTAALLTTFNDVDMTAVMDARARYKDLFEKKHGIRLGFMGFFVKAVALAAKDIPAVNARIEGDEIVYHDYLDVSVAVSAPKGWSSQWCATPTYLASPRSKKPSPALAKRPRKAADRRRHEGRDLHHLQRRRVRRPAVDPYLSTRRSRRCSACTGSRTARWSATARSSRGRKKKVSYDHRLVDGREAVTFLVRVKEADPRPDPSSDRSVRNFCTWPSLTTTSSSLAPGPAATSPRSAPRSSALRPPAPRAARRLAAPASTSAASPRRRCFTRPSCTPRPSRARSPSSASIFRARASTSTRCTPKKAKAVGELTGGIEFLFKKNKVDWLKGYAAFESANSVKVGDKIVTAKNIMIATGSSVTPLPGVDVDNDAGVIVDSTGALALPKVPEHMVVIGGGVIGLELGSVWLRLGAKVTVVEYLDQILPGMDEEVRKESGQDLQEAGLRHQDRDQGHRRHRRRRQGDADRRAGQGRRSLDDRGRRRARRRSAAVPTPTASASTRSASTHQQAGPGRNRP